MGWFCRARPRAREHASGTAVCTAPRSWSERMYDSARRAGSLPYLVEGFVEISEAVRRGHAVLLMREAAEVADGVTVFERPAPEGDDESVTVLKFSPRTARFVVSDPASPVGSIELTPKRLQRYLAAPARSTGVALGASFA